MYVVLKNPSASIDECIAIVEKETVMTPMKNFLENGECGTQEEKTMRQQTARFVLIGSNLYR